MAAGHGTGFVHLRDEEETARERALVFVATGAYYKITSTLGVI